MSWNLLIYRPGEDEAPFPLGDLATVRRVMDATFPGLDWPQDTECQLAVDGGFSITWTVNGHEVQDGYTNGGFNHLKELAALCLQQGWQMADAQEGEDIDLDDPYATFGHEDRE